MRDSTPIPSAFMWKRLHSFTGFFLALYLFEHLLINSQAALYIGENGRGFVDAVNAIHNLPFLPFIEFALLGVPILIHGIYGIRYLQTAQYNSRYTDGSAPSLPEYSRNKAYTWQRLTSWFLLFALAFHIIDMRFLKYPDSAVVDQKQELYMVRVDEDPGLRSVAQRLDIAIYDADKPDPSGLWQDNLDNQPLKEGEVLAVADSFGAAELMMVRETFKSPFMIAFYTLFVLTACFHAYNGLWTFMISWGITVTQRSQQIMLWISYSIMALVAFFGLSAIWGTYFFNLYK